MTPTTDLLRQVQEASVGSRELDGEIAAVLLNQAFVENLGAGKIGIAQGVVGADYVETVPPYTSSIDAALGLVERVRAGRDWAICLKQMFNRDGDSWWSFVITEYDQDEEAAVPDYKGMKQDSAPLAILAALLRAVSSKPQL